MSEDEVRERVEAFVVDFHGAWKRAGGVPSHHADARAAVDAWNAELARLVDSHCIAGACIYPGGLGGHPPHDPSGESITGMEVGADRATVRSVMEAGGWSTYYEYRLVRLGRDWKIGQLLTFQDPPGAPLVDQAEAERLLRSPSPHVALPALPSELHLDVPSLFAEGRRVVPFDEPVPLQLIRLGEFTCRSGILTVRDFGYGGWDLVPLALQVRPGTYPVDVSRAQHTNIALRLHLSDQTAVSWHPAEFTDGNNIVGVDAGNVAILDLATLVSCEAQHVEELYQQQTDRTMGGAAGTVFSLTGEVNDAVLVSSGLGDGAYPCYWGLAADGTVAALVVDFTVLVEEFLQVITVPWEPGPVGVPELAGHDLEIIPRDGAFVITHTGGRIGPIRVLAPDGTPLMDGSRLSLLMQGDRSSQTWEPQSSPPPGSTLEVTLNRGYRHT